MSISSIAKGLASSLNPLDLVFNGFGLFEKLFNYNREDEAMRYNRELQERLFERDDTQLTRLMKEYKDNGLNPLLAVPGASVGNTKGFESSAPQLDLSSQILENQQRKLLKEQINATQQQIKSQQLADKIAENEADRKSRLDAIQESLLNAKKNANLYINGLLDQDYKVDGLEFPENVSFENLAAIIGVKTAQDLHNKVDENRAEEQRIQKNMATAYYEGLPNPDFSKVDDSDFNRITQAVDKWNNSVNGVGSFRKVVKVYKKAGEYWCIIKEWNPTKQDYIESSFPFETVDYDNKQEEFNY